MQIKFLKKEGFDYKFLVQNTRNDVLSALRRTIMLHVPTFAVRTVSVFKNESVMPDEMLAHRLGLVPIYSDDVDNKEHTLYLKKTSGKVFSGDIEGSLDIPLKNIELTLLNENKTLELELLVNKGTGEEHVKYSPASVFFHNSAHIKQNGNVNEIVKLCPIDNLEQKANKVFLKNPYDCDLCRYCESKTNHALELIFNDDEFVFVIEPFGNLDLETIVKSSVDFLENELSELKSQLSGETLVKEVKIKKVKEETSEEVSEAKPKKAKKAKEE